MPACGAKRTSPILPARATQRLFRVCASRDLQVLEALHLATRPPLRRPRVVRCQHFVTPNTGEITQVRNFSIVRALGLDARYTTRTAHDKFDRISPVDLSIMYAVRGQTNKKETSNH